MNWRDRQKTSMSNRSHDLGSTSSSVITKPPPPVCYRRGEYILRVLASHFLHALIAYGRAMIAIPPENTDDELVARPVWWRSLARQQMSSIEEFTTRSSDLRHSDDGLDGL
jgi:hypothetical protein